MGFIEIEQLIIDRFTLSDVKNIEEISQRFRIIGTRTATDHDGIISGTVLGIHRDLGQIQYLKDVCIAHLILDGNSQKIHILYRILGFQTE